MSVHIFIQARMSSARFPGKMLAPVNGKPLIRHMIDRAGQVRGVDKVIVLTSMEQSDDPLAAYVGDMAFRGNLNNVFLRFQQALQEHPCDYFVRLCGDSPLISSDLIGDMIERAQGVDFLSNVHTKTFPKGQSVEIIRSDVFMSVDSETLTPDQQEHVMPYFYENADQYNTVFPSNSENLRHINTCVDTIEDLQNIEAGKVSYTFDQEAPC